MNRTEAKARRLLWSEKRSALYGKTLASYLQKLCTG